MAERQKKPHAIMISVPYQGHINPFTSLALKLASKGVTVTFVHIEFVHHRLVKSHHGDATKVDLFAEARKSGLDIRYATISDGLPLEYDRDLGFPVYWVNTILKDFPGFVDEFVGKTIESDSDSAHFLVTDTVFPWPATIAKKYNLVNVSFWTQPALVFSLAYHSDLLRENGHYPCKDDAEEEITYIPGVKSINTIDLMSNLKESEIPGPVHTAIYEGFVAVKHADFILHNIVEELEPNALSALNNYQPNYAIGPTNFYKNLPTNTVSRSLWSESDCAPWLQSKPPGSVLYVSFGSFVHASKQLIKEIAYGLLLSEVNFIWIIRSGLLNTSGDDNPPPDGYEDEIKDKGLIVPWCDQTKVLSDPAVGGFLTHNGWNSTLESMWFGVPMICFPMGYDQITIRKLVIDDWKMGISLCDRRAGKKPVNRKEVAEKIKDFMSGEGSENLRKEANKVKAVMRNALEVDGSSERNFDRFVKDLEAKIHESSS